MEPNVGVMCACLPMCRPALRSGIAKLRALYQIFTLHGQSRDTKVKKSQQVDSANHFTQGRNRMGDIEQDGFIPLADAPSENKEWPHQGESLRPMRVARSRSFISARPDSEDIEDADIGQPNAIYVRSDITVQHVAPSSES